MIRHTTIKAILDALTERGAAAVAIVAPTEPGNGRGIAVAATVVRRGKALYVAWYFHEIDGLDSGFYTEDPQAAVSEAYRRAGWTAGGVA